MRLAFDRFRFVLISLADLPNQRQQDALNYLQEENRVLREQFGGKRLRFDDQRRHFAARAKKLGRRTLQELTNVPRQNSVGPEIVDFAPLPPSRLSSYSPSIYQISPYFIIEIGRATGPGGRNNVNDERLTY